MSQKTEKLYGELRKKYGLPGFGEIESEFDLEDIGEGNLLRKLNSKIAEKMDFYTTVIEEMVQPDTNNVYAMHETRYFNEQEKKDMYLLYRRLMATNRRLLELSISRNEGEDANFISSFLPEWKGIKQELIKYVRIMKESWSSELDTEEEVGYLG